MQTWVQDAVYRCPTELVLTPAPLKRIIVIGSCLVAGWSQFISSHVPGCSSDFFLLNNRAELPDAPPAPPGEYDFQIVQIPLRTMIPDNSYFRLRYDDAGAYEDLFLRAKENMSRFLANAMRWNVQHGITTFVLNFLVPQQNPMGRLLPRYELRNFVHFVEKLNEALAEELGNYRNTHFFDFDQIVSTYGRRYLQDDAVLHIGHGSALSNAYYGDDQGRLEPVLPMNQTYPLKTGQYISLGWTELESMYRTIRQIDAVKLVIVDIDDTLWRGVAAERTEFSASDAEGWPLGVVEALGFLKRRGLLLAVVSKNTEDRVRQVWSKILGSNRLTLDDFAVKKINWQPKAQNIEEILREVNLLPRNVLFIDDNPVERAAVKAAFPEVRVLGPNPYVWRRILLWSSEVQVPIVTAESAKRTEMVKAQVDREMQRKELSHEDFLWSLNLKLHLFAIENSQHPRFARAFELINKTNQFNTTGKRWTKQECSDTFWDGSRFVAFEVEDRFTAYGLVGVIVVQEHSIDQFVMSCRVVGMDVEVAAVSYIMGILRERGADGVEALLHNTELNLLCRDLYQRCGFSKAEGGRWIRRLQPRIEAPRHIAISADESLMAALNLAYARRDCSSVTRDRPGAAAAVAG